MADVGKVTFSRSEAIRQWLKDNGLTDKSEDKPVLFPVEDVLHQLVMLSRQWTQEDFGAICYGLEPHQDVNYVGGKFDSFQRNGFIVAYAHLDGRNASRVCRWLVDKINES